MKPRLLMLALLGVIAGGLFAVFVTGPQEPPGTVRSTGTADIGGSFNLVDHTGKPVSEKDFLGRKTLVFFGFTNCPDICPSGLQVITAALESLGSKADGVTPVFISVDPERDTPAKMAEYIKSFHPRLIGLTGSVADVTAVAKAYKVYFRKTPSKDDPSSYSVDHSSIVYLMDEEGKYLRHFTHPTDVAKLAGELAKSL